ncbi:hypothetical protein AB0O34_05595 [Sphaerisporangium sp. NPDC088356]|uniref:hypothetical protein n=1 Tax=Sphaerisporangium sp. NPDC088356 TaxID=3154871 RepID=UPI003427097D
MRRPPTPDLSHYLVEWYRSDVTGELLEQAAHTIGRSIDEMTAEGTVIDLLLTVFVPGDEVGFCLFAAGSPASVEQACRRAGLTFDRIMPCLTPAGDRTRTRTP